MPEPIRRIELGTFVSSHDAVGRATQRQDQHRERRDDSHDQDSGSSPWSDHGAGDEPTVEAYDDHGRDTHKHAAPGESEPEDPPHTRHVDTRA